MLSIVLFLNLITSLCVSLTAKYIGNQGTSYLIISSLLLSLTCSLVLSFEVVFQGTPLTLIVTSWIDSLYVSVDWSFSMDTMNAWLISTVLLISLLVHIFATDYMKDDFTYPRFMCLLLAFTGFMVLLLAGDNLLVLFFGFEAIGIVSYLLISYWSDSTNANVSGAQAIIINRISDTILTILILGATSILSANFYDINYTYYTQLPPTLIEVTGCLILIAAAAKSAQFLLHTWLPQAMSGPTPVSSLLHAATLVLAGIYLILRVVTVVQASEWALIIASLWGIITALFAATTALFQADIKKIIAYSTCSQMGYLVASIGLQQSCSTILHLSSHAGFKALLFITAGGIIHSMLDQQDIRKYGGLSNLLPFTYTVMIIASLSLMAFPFLSGNISKELILELASVNVSLHGQVTWLLGSIVAGITAAYSIKVICYTFYGQPNATKNSYQLIHEQPIGLIVPMTALSLVAITFGYYAKESLAGVGTDAVVNYFNLQYPNLIEAEFLGSSSLLTDLLKRNLPLVFTVLGTIIGLLFFASSSNSGLLTFNYVPLYKSNFILMAINSLTNKWYVDDLYVKVAVLYQHLANNIAKQCDRGLFELLGAYGLNLLYVRTRTVLNQGLITDKVQNNVADYSLYIGLTLVITINLLAYITSINVLYLLPYLLITLYLL